MAMGLVDGFSTLSPTRIEWDFIRGLLGGVLGDNITQINIEPIEVLLTVILFGNTGRNPRVGYFEFRQVPNHLAPEGGALCVLVNPVDVIHLVVVFERDL